MMGPLLLLNGAISCKRVKYQLSAVSVMLATLHSYSIYIFYICQEPIRLPIDSGASFTSRLPATCLSDRFHCPYPSFCFWPRPKRHKIPWFVSMLRMTKPFCHFWTNPKMSHYPREFCQCRATATSVQEFHGIPSETLEFCTMYIPCSYKQGLTTVKRAFHQVQRPPKIAPRFLGPWLGFGDSLRNRCQISSGT